jgi:hypothetical protein
MEIFKVGETVYWIGRPVPLRVIGIKAVPPDQILYDPMIGSGGVGHAQWVYLESHKDTPVSGALLTHRPTQES